MKTLGLILTLLTMNAYAYSPEKLCYGFIDRMLNTDIIVNIDFNQCSFETLKTCNTSLYYDSANECSGSGVNTQCTQAQGIGSMQVMLAKKGKKIIIDEIIHVDDFEMDNEYVAAELKKIKKKLSFKVKGKKVIMKHGLHKTKMDCK